MNAQLSVDPWTLDARQDAQVGGEPRGAWGRVREEEEEEKKAWTAFTEAVNQERVTFYKR